MMILYYTGFLAKINAALKSVHHLLRLHERWIYNITLIVIVIMNYFIK